MELTDFLAKKDELEQKRASFARLQGRLAALLQRLQEEFSLPSLEAAERLRWEKQEALERIEGEYRVKLSSFRGEYDAKIN